MSNWNHNGQSYNSARQGFDNFYRYSLPPFAEQPVDTRGPLRPFNHPPVNRPPPPSSVRPPPPGRPPPVGRLPEPPLFYPHVPPLPFPPPPFPPPPDMYRCPLGRMPGPFNRPPPQNGHSVAPGPCYFQGFAPSQPSGNRPVPYHLPPGCPLPDHPLSNCPRTAARFDNRAMVPRPVNAFHQRPPGGLPYADQQKGFPMKRHLNTEYSKRKTKKRKVDKRDMAENNAFYCDRCDRGFKTEEKYNDHTAQHAKCKVKGCLYIAAPKLVQLHYDFHHRTGLAAKVWQQESADDIAKWISERKRNFPTAENRERKARERKEREARGEVLGNNKYNNRKYMRGCRAGRRHRPHHGWKDRSAHHDTRSDMSKTANSHSDTTTSMNDKDVKTGYSDSPVTCQAVKISSSCGQAAASVTTGDSQARLMRSVVSRRRPRPKAPNRRPTLLAKLLAADIRHERNVILQCIRFLTQHFHLHEKDRQWNMAPAVSAGHSERRISDLTDAAQLSAELHHSSTAETDGDTVGAFSEDHVNKATDVMCNVTADSDTVGAASEDHVSKAADVSCCVTTESDIVENIVTCVTCDTAKVSVTDTNMIATAVNHITSDASTHCGFGSAGAVAETDVCFGDISVAQCPVDMLADSGGTRDSCDIVTQCTGDSTADSVTQLLTSEMITADMNDV